MIASLSDSLFSCWIFPGRLGEETAAGKAGAAEWWGKSGTTQVVRPSGTGVWKTQHGTAHVEFLLLWQRWLNLFSNLRTNLWPQLHLISTRKLVPATHTDTDSVKSVAVHLYQYFYSSQTSRGRRSTCKWRVGKWNWSLHPADTFNMRDCCHFTKVIVMLMERHVEICSPHNISGAL